jgi:hypothetical protein
VTLADLDGGASATAKLTAQVVDARLSAGAPTTVHAVERAPFTGTVARFTDADPAGTPSDYGATIVWGDGATSSGQIQPDPGGGFDVIGTHTYAKLATSIPITVTIADHGGASIPVTSQGVVGAAPLSVTNVAINVAGNGQFSGVVAQLVDADPPEPVSSYTATINWGDGSPPSPGTITPTGSTPSGWTFAIQGTHSYTQAGDFQVVAQVADPGGSRATSAGYTVPLVGDTLQFAIAQFPGDIHQGTIPVVVTRTGVIVSSSTVMVTTSGGTATPGRQYVPVSTPITFAPGQTSATVSIPILNDLRPGPDVTVGLRLGGQDANSSLGSLATASLLIHDTNPALVTIPGVSLQKVAAGRRKTKQVIVIQFSSAVSASDAEDRGNYSLTPTRRGKKPIALAQAVYDGAAHTVTLMTTKKLVISGPLILRVNASGLHDLLGRLVDGAGTGQAGSGFSATV